MPAGIPSTEWDGFHDLIVIDEIARCGYLGVVWGLNCGNTVGLAPVVNFGTPEQRRRFIPDVLKGKKRFCLGITEPGGMLMLPSSWMTMNQESIWLISLRSWVRCCGIVNQSSPAGRRLRGEWCQKMDYERHVGRLLYRCRTHRWCRSERYFSSRCSDEDQGCDVPENRELRSEF